MEPNSVIKDLLECPVCMTFMHSTIHQCCNGHTICSTCKDKVDTCPTCREELGNIRNIALDKLAELIDLPCKFYKLGCEDCNFRPYKCPFNECLGTGDITSLVAHLKKTHLAKEIFGSTFNCVYKISNFNEIEDHVWTSLKIIVCLDRKAGIWISGCIVSITNSFNHQFFMHFEAFILGNVPVIMGFLRFMGEETKAKEFGYCLEIGGQERVMTWQGIPRSIRESDRVVRDSLDGLIIQKKSLELFLTDDGNFLKVAGRIWRKENN